MSSTNYIVSFGSGNPTANTGLSPTFTVFKVVPGGGSTTAPGITEIPSATGLYYFTYEPLTSMAFVIDGGSSLTGNARYIPGNLYPVSAADQFIGTTASSFGSTATDPSTVMGYLKRLQEFNEGNSVFTKTSGLWDVFARGNTAGASTLLVEKTLTDNGSTITKT